MAPAAPCSSPARRANKTRCSARAAGPFIDWAIRCASAAGLDRDGIVKSIGKFWRHPPALRQEITYFTPIGETQYGAQQEDARREMNGYAGYSRSDEYDPVVERIADHTAPSSGWARIPSVKG